MALVDVYDAVRARTLYRKCLSHDDTVEFIVGGKGTHFDPAVVDAFLSVAALFEAHRTKRSPTYGRCQARQLRVRPEL